MSASVSLMIKYLSEVEKTELALNLVKDVENTEKLSVLCELIAHVDSLTIEQIYPSILEFTRNAILKGTSAEIDCAIGFISQLKKLCDDVLAIIHNELIHETMNRFNFVEGYAEFLMNLETSSSMNSSGELTLNLNLFEFLTLFYTKVSVPSNSVAVSIDKLLCLFLGHKDDTIASMASKLIRWRINSLVAATKSDSALGKYLWEVVFKLIESGKSKRYQANAFIMWLRILNCDVATYKSDVYFQTNVINQEFYWQVLQNGLVSNSHEIRKFSLSILQLSLKSIDTSFETSVLSWNKSIEKNLLSAWSRYTTLFEILGIDTSLHQTQAAVNDILALISKDSLIHPSWGFCLLSTGFQASMDSVRKFSMQTLLAIKKENLSLMRYSLPFLEKTFLPYMMLARHFAVKPINPHSNKLECTYGEKFSMFLCNIMRSLTSPEDIQETAFSILKVLDTSRECFDAVRIYATWGLLKGLDSKRILQFGKHDKLILRLFDDFSEGALYKTTVQTLNLKLLLHLKLTSLEQFGEIGSQFTSFNGFAIFADHIDSIARYIAESGFDKADILKYCGSCLDDIRVIFVWIYTSSVFGFDQEFEELVILLSEKFICQILESGFNLALLSHRFKLRVQTILNSASENTLEAKDFDSLAQCPLQLSSLLSEPGKIFPLYAAIRQEVQSSNYGVLLSSSWKFKYLNRYISCFGLCDIDLSIVVLKDLKKLIFCNSAGCAGTVPDFYKLRETIFGEYHQLVALYVSNLLYGGSHKISEEEICEILELVTFGSTHFRTLFSIACILKAMFDHGTLSDHLLEKSVLGLFESFQELNSERLKLSDKELHVLLIEVMLHPYVLRSTTRISAIEDAVASFCKDMLASAQGRRGIFTRLVKAISDFQILDSASFEELPFIPNFMVRAACHRQLQHSAFQLETVIGKLYDSELSPHKSSIYQTVYGVEEEAAKVWTFAILNSINTPRCSKAIMDCIFQGDDEVHLFSIVNTADGAEDSVRSLLMQTALSVADKLDVETVEKTYFLQYIHLVENDPSPLVRVYVEWLIASLLLRKPEYSQKIFDKLVSSIQNHEVKPILVTIYERILYLMIQSMEEADEIKYLTKFATIIIPAASTNKAITRHFSMSLATSVYEEIQRKDLALDPCLKTIVDNMYRSAISTDGFGQYRSGDALLWNILDDLNLVNISGGLLLRLFDRDVDFLTKEDFTKYLSAQQIKTLTHPVGENQCDLWISELKNGKGKRNLQEFSDVAQSPLQTKSGAWSTVMDVDEGGPEVIRSELIVVASLVDKPPNLGGICRLCDVLGAGTLTIHDLKVKNHPQFKNVAVTADYWMPMIEVKPDAIREYLKEKKGDGYTLIGLEQTDKSVVLNNELKFPTKSLILLGREKEGIPGELLAELDFCVEINQVGVVRSMNIQTATAVIVHAYLSQHCQTI